MFDVLFTLQLNFHVVSVFSKRVYSHFNTTRSSESKMWKCLLLVVNILKGTRVLIWVSRRLRHLRCCVSTLKCVCRRVYKGKSKKKKTQTNTFKLVVWPKFPKTLLRRFQSTMLHPRSMKHHQVQNIAGGPSGRPRCYRKEQTFCGRNGLLLDDMPVSRGSCWAFWRQNCCRSAAA